MTLERVKVKERVERSDSFIGLPAETDATPGGEISNDDLRSKIRSRINPELPVAEIDQLVQVLMKHRGLFRGLGCTSIVEHDIPLDTGRPLFKRDFPRSQKEDEAVELQVMEWREQQVIERATTYRYNSPLVLVWKANGDLRLRIDYREVNSHTLDQNELIPLPEDIFTAIGTKKPRYIL